MVRDGMVSYCTRREARRGAVLFDKRKKGSGVLQQKWPSVRWCRDVVGGRNEDRSRSTRLVVFVVAARHVCLVLSCLVGARGGSEEAVDCDQREGRLPPGARKLGLATSKECHLVVLWFPRYIHT